MKNLLLNLFVMALIAGSSSLLAASDAEFGLVVTSEDLSERCILSVVVTAVDGKEVKETDVTDRFEFEPGQHSISGYGGVDPSLCATFAGESPVVLTDGERIGESTLKFPVEAGKEYYLGVDVRSTDRSKWKIVTWKVVH